MSFSTSTERQSTKQAEGKLKYRVEQDVKVLCNSETDFTVIGLPMTNHIGAKHVIQCLKHNLVLQADDSGELEKLVQK